MAVPSSPEEHMPSVAVRWSVRAVAAVLALSGCAPREPHRLELAMGDRALTLPAGGVAAIGLDVRGAPPGSPVELAVELPARAPVASRIARLRGGAAAVLTVAVAPDAADGAWDGFVHARSGEASAAVPLRVVVVPREALGAGARPPPRDASDESPAVAREGTRWE